MLRASINDKESNSRLSKAEKYVINHQKKERK